MDETKSADNQVELWLVHATLDDLMAHDVEMQVLDTSPPPYPVTSLA